MNGYAALDVKGGPKAVDITAEGYKIFKFKDGQTVKCSLTTHRLTNLAFGNICWQTNGFYTLEDEANKIAAKVVMSTEKGRPQDFFTGEICKDGKKVCTIEGNYMGYVDFDGVRYWDLRDEPHQPKHLKPIWIQEGCLESDSSLRKDRMYLCMSDYDAGQIAKEDIEEEQRKDQKLRDACQKRRAKGGPKYPTLDGLEIKEIAIKK